MTNYDHVAELREIDSRAWDEVKNERRVLAHWLNRYHQVGGLDHCWDDPHFRAGLIERVTEHARVYAAWKDSSDAYEGAYEAWRAADEAYLAEQDARRGGPRE